MHTSIKKIFAKIFTLSIIIVLVFKIGYIFINANISPIKNRENKDIFINANNINNNKLGKTGIAITTNIATYFKQNNNVSTALYQNIVSVETLQKSGKENKILQIHMLGIKEYLNILKTDIKKLIKKSYDRPRTLQAYIEQLEYRYINGIESEKQLINHRDMFINNLNEIQIQIYNIKIKMSLDFSKSDHKASLGNIKAYIQLKTRYHLLKTYVVYFNHFITQYDFLNNYNKNLATVLIKNKDAIIKDAYVVIPKEGGLEILKKFNLIYEQEEIK